MKVCLEKDPKLVQDKEIELNLISSNEKRAMIEMQDLLCVWAIFRVSPE